MAILHVEPKETEPGEISKTAKERLTKLVETRKRLGEHNFQTWAIYAPGTGRPRPETREVGTDQPTQDPLDKMEDRMRQIRTGWQGQETD